MMPDTERTAELTTELTTERAAVRTPVAPMFAEPRVASAQISQLVAGRVVTLLEQRDDWYRVCGPDEYEGWLHRGYLARVPGATARSSAPVPRISLGCVTTDGRGGRRAMPLNATLAPDERVVSGEAMLPWKHVDVGVTPRIQWNVFGQIGARPNIYGSTSNSDSVKFNATRYPYNSCFKE